MEVLYYFITHKNPDEWYWKIGSTRTLGTRQVAYIVTYNPIALGFGDVPFYEILNGFRLDVPASEIDEYLKKNPDRGFRRIRDTTENGGTELYVFAPNEDPAPFITRFMDRYAVEYKQLTRSEVKKLCKKEFKICQTPYSGPILKHELKDYQQEAHRKMEFGFLRNRIVQLIMPAGTGKTITVLSYAQKYFTDVENPHKILIGVSSKSIKSQFEKQVEKMFPAGSGTNITIIWYGESKNYTGGKFHLKIGDEAHHLTAEMSGDESGKNATFKQFHKIKSDRTIFMTATPKFLLTRKHNKSEEIKKYSMDNSTTFGPVVYEMSTRIAIDRKLITDFEVLLSEPELDFSMVDWASYVISGTFMDGRHCLIFMRSKAELDELQTRHRDLLIFTGDTKEPERRKILEQFRKQETGFLGTCDAIGEGFDDNSIDTIIMARNQNSHIKIYQNILRANRINPAKPAKKALYVLPLSESEYQKSDYKKVIDRIHEGKTISNLRINARKSAPAPLKTSKVGSETPEKVPAKREVIDLTGDDDPEFDAEVRDRFVKILEQTIRELKADFKVRIIEDSVVVSYGENTDKIVPKEEYMLHHMQNTLFLLAGNTCRIVQEARDENDLATRFSKSCAVKTPENPERKSKPVLFSELTNGKQKFIYWLQIYKNKVGLKFITKNKSDGVKITFDDGLYPESVLIGNSRISEAENNDKLNDLVTNILYGRLWDIDDGVSD